MGAADDRTHGLQVRVEDAPGFVVGVTDIVPGLWFLVAEFTLECHGATPSCLVL